MEAQVEFMPLFQGGGKVISFKYISLCFYKINHNPRSQRERSRSPDSRLSPPCVGQEGFFRTHCDSDAMDQRGNCDSVLRELARSKPEGPEGSSVFFPPFNQGTMRSSPLEILHRAQG